MAAVPRKSHFPVSLFATPHSQHQDVFYTVPRGGHLVGGPDHHVQRRHFPGHEMILCLKGRGFVRVAGRLHRVGPGDFAWINCHHPHEHGAEGAEPWEVLWIRAEGPGLGRLAALLNVSEAPVFPTFDRAGAEPLYREVFDWMQRDAPEAPAMIHAGVARLIALAFGHRARSGGAHAPALPPSLAGVVERMKLFYFERMRVADLAAMARMSESHFNRVFRATFGTSPIDWLRRERINQAKRRLAGTADAIKEIADQVGYSDRFFFSKDFKRLTGLTPREFRRRETLPSA